MKLGDLQLGDKIIADDGFTCLQEGEICLVEEALEGKFVQCSEGRHYLSGQEEDETGILIGFKY